MRYGTIGRSHLDNICEHLDMHERVFRSFGVPVQAFFNDPNARIESGPLSDNSVANYWVRFNIESLMTQKPVDFLLIDTLSFVADDLYFDSRGNIFPGDFGLLKLEFQDICRHYGWISYNDSRFLHALEQALNRFVEFMNEKHSDVRLFIADRLPTINYLESEAAEEIKLFSPFARYGSTVDYYNKLNTRLAMGQYVASWLHRAVHNSSLLSAPITSVCRPPIVESPSHFQIEDYRSLASSLLRALEGPPERPKVDLHLALFSHVVRSQESLMSINEWMASEITRLAEETRALAVGVGKLACSCAAVNSKACEHEA